MQKIGPKEQIKKTLWDFLCAQEKAKTSQTNEDIIFRDLTLCPCIESIYKYYWFCKKIDIVTEASRPDANLDIQVLGAVKKLRNRFFAHNVFSPFQTQKPEEINDIVILRKNNELDIDLVQKALFNTACKIFGFKNQEELINNLNKQNFPILTDSLLYKSTIDYIVQTNKLHKYLEEELGFTRKEVPYIGECICGLPFLEKQNRNRFLHEQLEVNPSDFLMYDPEIPMLQRHLIDMEISVDGKESTVKWIKTWIQQRKKMKPPVTSSFEEEYEACVKYYQGIYQATLAAMQSKKKSSAPRRPEGASR